MIINKNKKQDDLIMKGIIDKLFNDELNYEEKRETSLNSRMTNMINFVVLAITIIGGSLFAGLSSNSCSCFKITFLILAIISLILLATTAVLSFCGIKTSSKNMADSNFLQQIIEDEEWKLSNDKSALNNSIKSMFEYQLIKIQDLENNNGKKAKLLNLSIWFLLSGLLIIVLAYIVIGIGIMV